MNPRNIFFSLIAVSAAIFVSYSWYSVEPSLTVHLHCERKVTGTLQTKIIWPSGKQDKTKNFDIQKICNNGIIEFDNYKREKIVKFIFKHSDDKKAQVTSKYGSDIQSDQNGYYMILKITSTLPFISNGRI